MWTSRFPSIFVEDAVFSPGYVFFLFVKYQMAVIVSHLMWVQESELRYSGRARSAVNH